MTLFCNRWDVEDWLVELVREVSNANGVPPYIVMGIILGESGANPYACGDCSDDPRALYCPPWFNSGCSGGFACSWGLLQLNRCGGQGRGMTREALVDPRINLEVGVPPIADAYRGWGLNYCCLLVTSGHPYQSETCVSSWCSDPRVVRLVDLIECVRQEFPPAPAGGGTATIEGNVRDRLSGAVIPGVSVTLDTGQEAITDGAGYYRLDLVPAGQRTIRANHWRYRELRLTIFVQEGELIGLDLAMRLVGAGGLGLPGGAAIILPAVALATVGLALYGPVGLKKGLFI